MPVQQQLANYVQTTLASGITNAALTAILTSVAGLPTVGAFRLILKDAAPATTFEIVEVTSVNVGTATVTFTGGAGVGRGLEGTTAIAHSAGALVGNDITAAMLLLAFPWGTLAGGSPTPVVANQAGIGLAATDLTGLAATVTPGTSRRIRITVFIGQMQQNVASGTVTVSIQEGATVLGQAKILVGGAGGAVPFCVIAIVTPTAAAHTYKATAFTSNNTVDLAASATQPAFMLVEDIGQA